MPCIQQNGPITGYTVRYYATCGADRDVQQYRSVRTMDDVISGLTPNTAYAFQVAESMPMELARSVNPSQWEVKDQQTFGYMNA